MLRACRRVLKKDVPLAFFVVALADGLSARQTERGIEAGPPHADAGPGYGLLLREAGFSDIELVDVTDEYADTLTKSILVRESEANQLVDLIGEDMFTESQARRRSELDAVHSGILRRHLVSAVRP